MTLEHHLAALLEGISAIEPLDISLGEALGCQLAADVLAPQAYPHFAVCTHAGYAVRGDAVAGQPLGVVDRVAAGFAATQSVSAGNTIRVAAGAPVPHGAQSVVPDTAVTESGADVITLTRPAAIGEGIMAVGAAAAEGDRVLAAGILVDSRAAGVLAGLGLARVSVRPRPRVVLVSVGGGLVSPGGPVVPGLQFDAVSVLLAASAREAGGVAYRVGPIDEDPRAVKDALEDQLVRADLIVVSGDTNSPSTSLRSYLASLRTIEFDDESTNLGSFGHGVMGEEQTPCLALPNDPASAAVLFTVLAHPIIAAMRGVPAQRPITVDLAAPVPRRPTQTQLLLARLHDHQASPLSSGDPTLMDLVDADAIIRVLAGAGEQEVGSRVPALPLGGHP